MKNLKRLRYVHDDIMHFPFNPPALPAPKNFLKFSKKNFKKPIDKHKNIGYTVVKLMIMIIVIINRKVVKTMAAQRNSKQRDAVFQNLSERYDHPTAEEVYLAVRETNPTISLATVYRNLRLLESEGKILKIPTPTGDRFDGHTHRHSHFTCGTCGKVLDLELKESVSAESLIKTPHPVVTGYELMFFGICNKCKTN